MWQVLFRAVRAGLALSALLAPPAMAADAVNIYLFWREGCPHCEREITYLRRLETEQPAIRVHYFDVWNDAAGRALLVRIGKLLSADASSVPFTVVGDTVFSGYLDDTTSGAAIRQRALHCLAQACPDSVRPFLTGNSAGQIPPPQEGASPGPTGNAVPASIRLPFLGEVAIKNISLPLLTITLAALDGFNPCAMWTLLLLLGLLIGMRDRRRRWILGASFIVASAVIYFLFMAAWLNLFLFLGMLLWVRLAIGLVAIGGGGYYLREYLLKREAVCAVTAPEQRRRVFDRLQRLSQQQQFWLALTGIVLLAFAVNLVELLCSAGIPAVYTHVLALSELPAWQRYLYLLLYIFVFLLDDLIVFFTVMKTLEVAGLGTRYARISHLIGGIVLVILGALLLLRPEWLLFG
jgi:thiol-disulfide isomerase/thioredoxin